MIAMLIDHIGATIVQNGVLGEYMGFDVIKGESLMVLASYSEINHWIVMYIAMRLLGRLAFPIFCFLLVEGFLHTQNIKKYCIRLLIFSVISEIPFDLAMNGELWCYKSNNVFITLFIALLVLISLNQIDKIGVNRFAKLATIIIGIIICKILHSDYASSGIILITILYVFRENTVKRNIFGSITMCWGITAPLAFIPIHFYNGNRGMKLKYTFYIFYPLHLLFLGLIVDKMY